MVEMRKTNKSKMTTMDDFIRFLEANAAGSKCAACGAQSWVVVGNPKTDEMVPQALQFHGDDMVRSMSTYVLYCNQCGLTRSHLAPKVDEWMAKNSDPESLEDEALDGKADD